METARAVQWDITLFLLQVTSMGPYRIDTDLRIAAVITLTVLLRMSPALTGDILMYHTVRLVWPVFRLLLPWLLAREMKLNCYTLTVFWLNTSSKMLGPLETSRLNTACRTHHNPLHRFCASLASSLYWFLYGRSWAFLVFDSLLLKKKSKIMYIAIRSSVLWSLFKRLCTVHINIT